MITIRFKHIFRERLPEWATSTALFFWGLIVYSQDNSLWTREFFSVLAEIGDQKTWGIIAMAVGSMRIIALGINGLWRPTAHIRAIGALIGSVIWTAIILGYLGLNWVPPALATQTVFLALDLTSLWYAAGDAKMADILAGKSIKRLPVTSV